MKQYFTTYATANSLGRWLQVDPLADKYPGWSPYNYCVNNPVRMVDPDGRDTLTFDHNGNYLRSSHILDKDGNFQRSFAFLDPTDVKSIQTQFTDNWLANGDRFYIKGIDLSFENTLVYRVLKGLAPVIDLLGTGTEFEKFAYAKRESMPEGKMDYLRQLKGVLNSKLAIIGGMAYNNCDTGNYMWGMAMSLLGLSPAEAQFAARMYERIYKKREDQVYDQTAIWNGANYLKVK